jgi:hypothetical protein
MGTITKGKARAALAIAMVADVVQLGLFPLLELPLLWLNEAIDVAVAIVMLGLLGWHWALLPTLLVELVPALNLFPTWTAAVIYITRQAGVAPAQELVAARGVAQIVPSGAPTPPPQPKAQEQERSDR